MKKLLKTETAYLYWLLCFVGLSGCQRFYAGKYGSGVLYLFTGGLLFVGQFIDLFLIPEMVESRNIKLGLLGYQYNHNLQPVAEQLHPGDRMAQLIQAAKENGGVLSPAQIAMTTKQSPEQNQLLIDEAIKHGYCEISNDPETGRIRYQFDV